MLRRDFLLTLAALATKAKKPKVIKIQLVPPIGIYKHDTNTVVQQIKRGFSFWSDVSNVVFEFVERKADFTVVTTEVYLGYSGGTFLHARGRYLPKQKQIQIHNGFVGIYHGNNPRFNTKPYWVEPLPNPIHIASVVAHEFGHALGLDHSNDTNAVMHINGNVQKLSASEIKFAQKKFGSK